LAKRRGQRPRLQPSTGAASLPAGTAQTIHSTESRISVSVWAWSGGAENAMAAAIIGALRLRSDRFVGPEKNGYAFAILEFASDL
jgi:hypothetical protein